MLKYINTAVIVAAAAFTVSVQYMTLNKLEDVRERQDAKSAYSTTSELQVSDRDLLEVIAAVVDNSREVLNQHALLTIEAIPNIEIDQHVNRINWEMLMMFVTDQEDRGNFTWDKKKHAHFVQMAEDRRRAHYDKRMKE